MTALVGVLVALAVLAAAGPAGRTSWRRAGTGRDGVQSAGRGAGVGRTGRRPARSARARAVEGRGGDLGAVLLAVAARLRAGAPPDEAWRAVLGPAAERAPGEPLPSVPALLAAVERGAGHGLPLVRRPDAALRVRAHAVVVGTRTATELGAPLADVLDDLAASVAADAEHAGEVAAALAGPRATARVLVLLPALGVLVGTALGARPWDVLTSGGAGTACGALGLLLVLAGRAWVTALLRRTAGAGGRA